MRSVTKCGVLLFLFACGGVPSDATAASHCKATRGCATTPSQNLGNPHKLRGSIDVVEVTRDVWDTHAHVPLAYVNASSDCPSGVFQFDPDKDWMTIETDHNGDSPRLRLWLSNLNQLVDQPLEVSSAQSGGKETWRATKASSKYGEFDYYVYIYQLPLDSNGMMEKQYGLDVFPPKNIASDACNAERPENATAWRADKKLGLKGKFYMLQINSGQGGEPNHP